MHRRERNILVANGVQSGKIVCVDKGEWDKSMTQEDINSFNLKWLSLCREKLKDNGTRSAVFVIRQHLV